MRITREILLKLAQDTVSRQVREDRSIMAAYLCGSLLEGDYMLGGTADIDLFFVHFSRPEIEREIVRLTDEIHLDIAHHSQQDYRYTRQLRLHPWLGPALTSCMIMYDPQHFMDFIQASVRGQFGRPDRVLARSRKLLDVSRQIWFNYQSGIPDPGPVEIEAYLRAVGHAANAVANLNGLPLTERRFLLSFPQRAQALERPGLFAGLLGLLGGVDLNREQLSDWLPAWKIAYQAIPEDNLPVRLHPARFDYYQRAFETMLRGEQPLSVLWPLLRTWTLAARHLSPGSPGRTAWAGACAQLNLLYEAFVIRVSALDAYLDLVDETLEDWGRKNGVW